MPTINANFKIILLTIALILIVGLIYIDNRIIERFNADKHISAQQQLSKISNRLSSNLYRNIHIVQGLPALFSLDHTLSQNDFATSIHQIFKQNHQLRNIAAAPDLVIRYMYPMEGNEAAVGLDYRTLPSQFSAVERAKTSRKLVLAGPFTLVQGGVGIVARIPVYLTNSNDDEYFWGVISSVIDADKLYHDSGLFDSDIPLDIAIRGKDGLGSEGEFFFGNAEIINQEHIVNEIILPEGGWQLIAKPKTGWQATPDNIWQTRFYFALTALVVFALAASYLRALTTTVKANEKFKYVIEDSPVAYVMTDRHDNITYLNKEFIASFGYNTSDIPNLKQWWLNAIPDESYRHHVQDAWESYLERTHLSDELPPPLEVTIQEKYGKTRTALISVTPDYLYHKEYPIVLYDITERKQAEEQVLLLSRIFSETHDGILITDPAGIIVNVNPSFARITGYSKNDVIGENPNILSSGKHSAAFFEEMWLTLSNQGYWHGELWNRKKGGELYAELLTISSIKVDGKLQHYIGLFSDITESKQQQESLKQIAHYDMLTGLPNRILLLDRFKQSLAHSHRTHNMLAVCFLDLDDFKPVNDSFGHDIGDQLLVAVSQSIQSHIRESDTVSRIGGDEFILLLSELEAITECELLIKRLLNSLSKPFQIAEHSINISASCGITVYPSDDADLDTLMRHADQAMYQAKLSGKNRFRVFNAQRDKKIIEQHSQLHAIQDGLEQGQMQLYYQPKVNMTTGEVLGAEALIRWIHPNKGLIPPIEFLPVLDGTALEITLGNWVIETALVQLEQWLSEGITFEVSVNISSHHLQSPNFILDLEAALARHSTVSSELLQLEILESSALSDLNLISQIIKTCRNELGVHIALDDFGTGYSSLTHLRNLDTDTIKIDQTFVRDVLDDPDDYAIIDGVIGLARSFNRDIIAEGVETTEHGLMLIAMGCEQAQGYAIGYPMTVSDFNAWLTQHNNNPTWLAAAEQDINQAKQQSILLKLTTQHWLSLFNQAILAEPDQPSRLPIMDREKCHHSVWIERFKQADAFNKAVLVDLDKVHEQMHDLADIILNHYQSNNIDHARSLLTQLKHYDDRILALIDKAI